MLELDDIETIEKVMENFNPLSIQEQELLLFMCIHSMFELCHMEKQTDAIERQISTYRMFVDLLTKNEIANLKECIFKQVQADYNDIKTRHDEKN